MTRSTIIRDVLVQVRLTAHERARWTEIAHGGGMTLSELVRECVRSRIGFAQREERHGTGDPSRTEVSTT